MELLLFAVIFLQLAYLVYSDIQNRKERADLQLKIMAKDLEDYKSATEEAPEPAPSVDEDPYLTFEEAGVDRVVHAKEKS
jgi:hypothetical protein